MSVSSISNCYLAALSGQYYNPYVNTNNNTSDSTSTGNLKKVNAVSSDGDTFQLSEATTPAVISASDVYSNMAMNDNDTVSEPDFASARPVSDSDTVDPLISVLDNLYSSMDTNGDGTVSEPELSAALASSVDSAASTADSSDTTSSSQALTSDDLYSIMDTNDDGTVSESEFSSVISSLIKDLAAGNDSSNGVNLQAATNPPGPSPVPFAYDGNNAVSTSANATEKV